MDNSIHVVCEKFCCCDCLCSNIGLLIVLVAGVLVAISLILCFIYFCLKGIKDFIIENKMINNLNN